MPALRQTTRHLPICSPLTTAHFATGSRAPPSNAQDVIVS